MKKIITVFFALAMFLIARGIYADNIWNNASNDCPSIAIANYTTNIGYGDPCWPLTSVSASSGDSINIRIYYHNTSLANATNTRVFLSATTINNTTSTHYFTGQITSDQGSISFGPVYANLTSPQKLTFGSSRWYPNQSQVAATFLNGQTGAELISSDGLYIGTIGPGWATQGSVVAAFYVNYPNPTGVLTASTSSCVISVGQGNCSIPFSWNTYNPIGTSTVVKEGGGTVATGNSGTNVPFSISYGSSTYKLYNNNIVLDSETVSATCAAGSNYNSTTGLCQQLIPTGTLTSSNSSCTISNGQSSCSIPFSWNTNNPIGTSAVTRSGQTVATGNSGTNVSLSVPYGSQTFYLYNSGYELDTETVSSACVSGTTYNANTGTCQQVNPTGTLTASTPSCIIGNMQSSCSIPFSWNTNNPIGTSAVTRNNMTVATGNSGTNVSLSVPYGSQTFYLYNGGYQLDTETVSASCGPNGSWSGYIGMCIASNCQITSFTANPTSSSAGLPVVLSWTTNYCNSVNISNVGNNLEANGNTTVYPTTTTTYTLTGIGSTSVTPTQSVEVVVGNPAGAPGFPVGAPGYGIGG